MFRPGYTARYRPRVDATATRPPGAALGLPASGSGSPAPLGRRVGAFLMDGLVCDLVAALFRHIAGWNVVVLIIEYLLLLPSGGQTLGMWVAGIRVVSLRGGRIRPWWALLRTVLLVLLVPAVVLDRDRRGLHDRASGTVVVRT